MMNVDLAVACSPKSPSCNQEAESENLLNLKHRMITVCSTVQLRRYVTKASLRHITANDEASSLSGDFIGNHAPACSKVYHV